MTSAFAWLDFDEPRRQILDVVDLFREKGTLQILGSARSAIPLPMVSSPVPRRSRPRPISSLPAMDISANRGKSVRCQCRSQSPVDAERAGQGAQGGWGARGGRCDRV